MVTPSRFRLSLFSSLAISGVVALVAFSILRGMNAEVRRMEALGDIADKTRALHVLTAAFKEDSAGSDVLQIKQILLSLEGLLKTVPSRGAREEALIEQLRKSYDELGPLIDQWSASAWSPSGLESERTDMLASQIRMKVQFISDDRKRLRDISQTRILAAQERTGITIVVLIVLLAVTNGAIYLFSVRTIVRSQRALLENQQRLRESREDLKRAQAVAHVGSWRLNVLRNELTWSDESYRIAGIPKGTPLTYESFLAIVHPEDREYVDRKWKAALQGEPYDIEHRIVVNGEIRWARGQAQLEFDAHGQLLNGFGAFHDITERKRAEETLRESEERFRNLVSVITDVPWTTNAEGNFVTPQPAWERYTGQTWDEQRGFGWTNALHPEDRETVKEMWEAACLTRSLYESHGRIWHAPTKQWRYFEARATPLFHGDGALREWVGTCTDVEERKRAEETLRDNQHRLELALEAAQAADRAKDRFLATLSHELRTPLTPVLMTVATLLRGESWDADTRRRLEVIRRNVEAQAQMINDLLDLSRIIHDKLDLRLGHVDAHQILQHTLDICTADGDDGKLQVTVALDAQRHHVRGDEARLQQVFWNLIQNAFKFTPAGGKLAIRSTNDGGRLRLTVSDTGRGIEAQLLARIFEPFEQGDRQGRPSVQGLGLGLAIARRIVAAHGGSITAVSDGPGRGATFTVELDTISVPPEASDRTRHEKSQSAPDDHPVGGRPR